MGLSQPAYAFLRDMSVLTNSPYNQVREAKDTSLVKMLILGALRPELKYGLERIKAPDNDRCEGIV